MRRESIENPPDNPSKFPCTFCSQGGLDLSPDLRASNEGFLGHTMREHRIPTRQSPSLCFHHFQSSVEFMPAGCATDAI